MLGTAVFVLGALMQSPAPAIDPSSIYGMKTYPNNPEFGFFPEKIALGFAPADPEQITMHVMKGDTEVTSGGFYPTETPYQAFRMLRFKTMPTVTMGEPGDYLIEFRNAGTPVSQFPFKLKKETGGDEFNPTLSWDFITPVDRMGNLTFSNQDDTYVWLNLWLAPRREGIAPGTMVEVTLSHGGKVVGEGTPLKVQEMFNARRGFRLHIPGGRTAFTKSKLLALSGPVVGMVKAGGKTIRSFTWNVSNGKVALHPRSAADFSPRTDYWIPRRLAGSPEGYQFFHLEEQYWAASQ